MNSFLVMEFHAADVSRGPPIFVAVAERSYAPAFCTATQASYSGRAASESG
jgi:hypothetical protein